MKLSNKDADLFFELMFPLQLYVNKKSALFPESDTLEAYRALDMEFQVLVRDELWENPELLAQYVAENPNQLPAEQLEIVASWQTFVKSRFVIERFLKKYAVFIDEDAVYGVLGLHNSLDELIPKEMLPVFVETVLVPFKDQIVYDGVLRGANVMIGRNMSLGFKDTYMKAKREGAIITSFNPEVQAETSVVTPLKNWQPALEQLSKEAKKLRAQAGSPPTWGPAFSLVKASLAFAETAVANPDDLEALWKSFERVIRSANRVEDGIYRSGG